MGSARASSRSEASLLSLPNELLLELLNEPSSLHLERQEKQLTMDWFTWNMMEVSKYTVPWSRDHHPAALPLSQTCTRLRALVIPRIWEEVGISTLEELAKVRDGLRLFPERGELILRLEWSWLMKHPAYDDLEYRAQHPELEDPEGAFMLAPLGKLLQPPHRWPKQPFTTKEECVEAITEVMCRLTNLDTLLWVSPYLPMQRSVVEHLASQEVSLKSFQIDVAGEPRDSLVPDLAPYWKFSSGLERLSIRVSEVSETDELIWQQSDIRRLAAYDDDLSGLEEFCEQKLQQEEKQEEVWQLTETGREKRLQTIRRDEQQAAVAYKTLITACQGKLRDLTVEPRSVLQIPALAPHWVGLEAVHELNAHYPIDPERFARLLALAHQGKDTIIAEEGSGAFWYMEQADWHLAAAAIRPAIYHAARHRVQAGPLTAADIQALAEKPPHYPLSLFYPCFRDASVAQGMAEVWESLVEQGESERVVCRCAECQGE